VTEAKLETLGRFALKLGGLPVAPPSTQRAIALLVYLIVHADRAVARESVVELFWPNAEPDRARASLKTATWSIRRNIRAAGFDPDEMLFVGKQAMRWIGRTEVDVGDFTSLANSKDPNERLKALDLYRGDFLEGNYEDWVIEERERLAAIYERVLREAVERTANPTLAQRLVARNPYDEHVWGVLIDAELKVGRPMTARLLAERCREALREVGAVPSADFEKRLAGIPESTPQQTHFRLPFIGRERELATLAQCWQDARSGVGSITVVGGEAGIGKSTMLQQAQRTWADRALAVRQQAVVDDPRTFGMWVELFEKLCSVPFAEFAKAGGPDIVGRLAEELVRRLPQHAVVLIDDAHALEGEAFAVLIGFLRLAAANGNAAIVTTRPEGLARLQTALSSGVVRQIHLDPLAREEVEAAVRRSLDMSGDTLPAWLFERSGGHPYFLNSLVRALQDDGVIERSAMGWKAKTMPARSRPLPRDLRLFIEARLQARGETTAALACALAIDPEASTSDLVAALDLDESAVMDAIDDLLALGLIQQPAEGPEFVFNHHLTAEVASTLLNSARRMQIHAGLARRLADTKHAGASLRRARHLDAAGQTVEAAQAYLTAAREALEWFAWRDALVRAEAGIKTLERFADDPSAAGVLMRLSLVAARACAAGGDDRGSLAPADRAISLARDADDHPLSAEALHFKAVTLLNLHEIDGSIAAATTASTLARELESPQLLAQQLTILCVAYAHVPNRDLALVCGRNALKVAQQSGAFDIIAASADALLRAQIMWWQFADAHETATIGLEAARRANWVAEGAMRLTLGMLWYYCEEYARATHELEQARAVAVNEHGERRWLVSLAGADRLKLRFFATYVLGMVAAAQQRWEDALAIVQELSQADLFNVSYMVRNNVLHLWIDALLGRGAKGDSETARALAAQLRDDAYEQGSLLDFSACVALSRARAAAASGALDAASALHSAHTRVAELAALRPLECDRAFLQLGLAAAQANEGWLEEQAQNQAAEFRLQRQAATAAWRGGAAAPR
jgi:DNA-binding SARP family transcriptional activator